MRVVVSVIAPSRDDTCLVAARDGTAEVRAEVGRQLTRWRLHRLIDDALLIATELLSNAVRHGTPPLSVRMWLVTGERGRRRLRLEVEDAGPGIDMERVRAHWRHPSFTFLAGGRGLFIVDTLACRWGDTPSRLGHTVWAELDATPPGPDRGRAS
ncbi:ATP-binding protein [Streptomyces sp. NPDC003036]|uniref:ATP-binding protein n=1 Tax=Streptomyces sp. NPDC003036 TaxID=3154442 RepID=UPI0033A1DDC0